MIFPSFSKVYSENPGINVFSVESSANGEKILHYFLKCHIVPYTDIYFGVFLP